jgi:hypothetical protein
MGFRLQPPCHPEPAAATATAARPASDGAPTAGPTPGVAVIDGRATRRDAPAVARASGTSTGKDHRWFSSACR